MLFSFINSCNGCCNRHIFTNIGRIEINPQLKMSQRESYRRSSGSVLADSSAYQSSGSISDDNRAYSTTWLDGQLETVPPLPRPQLAASLSNFDYDGYRVPIPLNSNSELLASHRSADQLRSLPAWQLSPNDLLNKMYLVIADNENRYQPLTAGEIIDLTLAPQDDVSDTVTIFRVVKTLSEMIRTGRVVEGQRTDREKFLAVWP